MRTEREGRKELWRLLEQAIRCLESTDLQGANEALERANAAALDDNVRRRNQKRRGPLEQRARR